MHSIVHHCLDVAACASALVPLFPPPGRIELATVGALVALHDIGKFSRTFQAKRIDLWPQASLGPYKQPPAGHPHDGTGLALLTDGLEGEIGPLFEGWIPEERLPVLRAVTGHHGRPPQDPPRDRLPPDVVCTGCIAAGRGFVTRLLEVITPPSLPSLDQPGIDALTWWLAGLTTLADWIGSGQDHFPPVDPASQADLAAYWRDWALPRAKHAVAAAELKRTTPSAHGGFAGLFPELAAAAAPSPLQKWAERVMLPDGPALFVIEDATGSGKTEAALLLAHRFMAAGRADGAYFALPTMATANAMFGRMQDAYARLFVRGARPSLVLAHGKRSLDERFTDSILEPAATRGEDTPADEAGDPASAQCAAWIADDRRKAFLAEIGVGTIDQALLAVLPTKHAALRFARPVPARADR